MPNESLIELQPRSNTEYISENRTVLITDREGWITGDSDQGLWIYEARTLSHYRWTIDGKPPQLSAFSPVNQNSSIGYYIATPKNWKQTETKDSNPAQRSIELRVGRAVGDGLHEDVWLTNHTQIKTVVDLALEIASDFESPSDLRSGEDVPGEVRQKWRSIGSDGWQLHFDYKARHKYEHQGDRRVAHIHRGIRLCFECELKPKYRNGKIHFKVNLSPREIWKLCLSWIGEAEGRGLALGYGCDGRPIADRHPKHRTFLTGSTKLTSPASPTFPALVLDTLDRSKQDLAALRLFDLDARDQAGETWIPAAGLPTYLGLFGRDSLASSWQAALLSAAMMRGTLAELPKTQGTKIDDWRAEQPGRFVHELHSDPRAVLNYTPHSRYYGGVTGSIYYPVVLSAVWHWTGDKQLIKSYIEPALKGLAWADKYSRDSSGFYRYRTRSKQGERNQGWKDSDDAIVHADGSQVKDPLGTCEMQGFVYASKMHLSEVLWWIEEFDVAKRLMREAEELKKRFNDFFWMEDAGYLGMAVDSKARLVRSIASDPGHCLASGIVDHALAARMADRMMRPDMFSGWGVRTLSADHPAFNPFSYHRGSVWPVENAVFVLAFARYGLHDKMQVLAHAMFETAGLFKYCRLPEVFAGHQRDADHPFPGMYPRANWPQAWSASAPFTVMQALLGIYPYAPLSVLFLDPWLPEWLPEFSIEQMRVGNATISLKFHRNNDARTNYEITDLTGKLHVIRQPSPWSLTAGFGERVKDAIVSLLPGKVAS
jgi:glycogen debranching enzyme